jgi:hypothetical protein
MISSHVVKGATSAATFSLLVQIGGRKEVALVNNGSTDSFIDYTFVSKTSCNVISMSNLSVKVVAGGTLDTCVVTAPTQYSIQQQNFDGQFRLLQLKGVTFPPLTRTVSPNQDHYGVSLPK